MTLSRPLTWIILLGTILMAGILRQFHEMPVSPFLPWPVRSLLFFLVLILFLVFLRGWRGRQEIPYAGQNLRRVNFLAFLPLLIALTLEKWISITFYEPVFDAINGDALEPVKANALYVIESALGLFVVSLALLPLFRRLRPMLGHYLAPRGIILALGMTLAAMAVLFGSLFAFFSLAPDSGVHLRWRGCGPAATVILLSQVLIAFSEEFYYRGLLQSETAFLLPSLGVTHGRSRRLGAVLLISLAFALEHRDFRGTPSDEARKFLFTLSCSAFLGILVMLLDNLWLSTGCHFILNCFMLGSTARFRGGGLQFVDLAGRPVLDPSVYIFLFFTLVFILAYVKMALASRAIEPPAPAKAAAA